MKRLVNGIGGIFFRANDSKALSKWYEEHFGISDSQSAEPWRQDEVPTGVAPFKKETTYFGNMNQQFMINFRVSDMDALLLKLEKAGVKIDKERMDESYGKFAWVYDPEGNKIELWEPKD